MMMYYMLFVCLSLIRFSQTRIISATKPINESCLNFGHAHDCEYYSCFEERFPCGSTYWISDWGYKYCTRMRKSLVNFDKIGQKFVDKINTCLINKLNQQNYYTLKQINCEQLRLAAQKIVHDCYMLNFKLFCNAFHEKNRDCFLQLMDNRDRQDFSMLRTLASVGQKCTPKKRLIDMRSSSLSKKTQCVPLTML